MLARDNTTALDADLNAFGQEWQVQAEEPMLFHNIEGPQAPSKCVIPTPQAQQRRLGESTISLEQAKIACAIVPEGPDQDDCVMDILLTEDLEMAGAY